MPSSPTELAVRVERLVVDYPRGRASLRVLGGIDLSVERGEIFGVIGASGCGKTTLLGALLGLVRPSSGSIDLAARSVAMVFQRPQLLPWKNVLDNAAYGLECRGEPLARARERARPLLERMKLEAHLGDHPHRLSEGMKQRVNLARALLVEPELLLMDEPYQALDPVTRRALMDELLESRERRPFTVIFASHSLDEVAYLSDRVAALSEKPARVTEVARVELPRPRGADPEGAAALFSQIERLKELLS
jgi:NitT/TauT family transport system ATP-binding protein